MVVPLWLTLLVPSLLGKSALHWAAAVNNVEATIALLKNGANKDMQDSKVSFLLYLAFPYNLESPFHSCQCFLAGRHFHLYESPLAGLMAPPVCVCRGEV